MNWRERWAGQDWWGSCWLLLEGLGRTRLLGFSFLSRFGLVFLLTITLQSHEKLYFKVLLVLSNVSRVSSIAKEMWGVNFQGC